MRWVFKVLIWKNEWCCWLKCLLFEERIDFAMMKLAFNGLNKKNMPENLELKVV